MARDTIFALSSGTPPAAIAVVRLSGPGAGDSLVALTGRLPRPRVATGAPLRDPAGGMLDQALVLWLPAPHTVTGEDVAELHLHGGRAVVAAVLAVLGQRPSHRLADPGEFTRRAFEHGRLDLPQAEALADLLAAETEVQRRHAQHASEGALSRKLGQWRDRLLGLAARIEAVIEFGEDTDEVAPIDAGFHADALALSEAFDTACMSPPAERLRVGVRIVFAGPPNAGKSSLINALAGRPAAIVSPVAGTTRDLIEVPIALDGLPIILIDTAGVREARGRLEARGVALAQEAIKDADLIVWLGDPAKAPADAVLVTAKSDRVVPVDGTIATSTRTGEGLDALRGELRRRIVQLLPREDQLSLNIRQRSELASAAYAVRQALTQNAVVLVAEHLRSALCCFDRLLGRSGVESMLDVLFSRFCIGK